jgi:hypothetical protein
MAPTLDPEAVVDALAVIEMGGDPHHLAAVCRARAVGLDDVGRQRLLDAAVALTWAAQLLGILDSPETPEGTNARH